MTSRTAGLFTVRVDPRLTRNIKSGSVQGRSVHIESSARLTRFVMSSAAKRLLRPATTAHRLLARRFGELMPATVTSPGTDTATGTGATKAANTETVKSISDLDGPTAWPLIGNFWTYIKKENRGRLHEVQARQHKEYGKMFLEKLGPRYQVHLSDPDLIEIVLRNQGKYPIRSSFNSWKVYRNITGEAYGLLTSEGKDWQRIRSVLSKRMLKPKLVGEFAPHINVVVGEMVDRLQQIRNATGSEQLARELPNELYKWAMESIGIVLFETRMGCLGEDIPPRVQEFINAISEMMSSSLQVMIGEDIHRRLNTKFWRRHKEAWDSLFEIARSYVDARFAEIRANVDLEKTHDEVPAEFLTFLLASKQLSLKEIYSNVTECMLGGVDTTSNTLCFTLHMLAQHPHVQEKLAEEMTSQLNGRSPTAEDLKNMSYLKCIVKETLRLYPVVTMNVRQLDEDIILNGYRIPRDTMFVLNHYAACRDEAVFDNATEFKPERWNRMDSQKAHAFAALPFGYGTRSCVGRRIAELEIYLALIRICRKFVLEPMPGMVLNPQLRTLLAPGSSGVPVMFRDR